MVDLSCMCASFRRASRALADVRHELRPVGLQATQFTILQAGYRREITQGRLGGILLSTARLWREH